MTNITATTGINPLVQPLNTGEEEQRVASTTRNAAQDNVSARGPEASDEPSPRNNSQSSTQPQEEINRRDDPELQSRRAEISETNSQPARSEVNLDTPERPANDVTVTLSDNNESEANTLSRDELVAQAANEQTTAEQRNEPAPTPPPDQNEAAQAPVDRNDLTDGDNLQREQAENAAQLAETREAIRTSDDTEVETAEDDSSAFSPSLANQDDESDTTVQNALVSSFLEQNAEQRVGINLNAIA